MNDSHPTMYIHMYEVAQEYGGPEEGGWWYEAGRAVSEEMWQPLEVTLTQKDNYGDWDDEKAFQVCRQFNAAEHRRREELTYGYSSVLSYREEFFAYDVSEDPYPQRYYPVVKPHYE